MFSPSAVLLCLLALACVSAVSAWAPYSAADGPYAPKPAIAHSFRAPDARPAGLISLLFTGAIWATFGALLVALGRSGVSVSLPTHPSELLYSIVFQSALAAILGTYALYWIKLNIFEALALIAVCGIVAIFAGTGALRLLHQRTAAAAAGKSVKKTE